MMSDITWSIKRPRELTLNDLHDMFELRVAVFVVEQNCAYQEVDGKDLLSTHVIARDTAGRMVACARIVPPEKDGHPHLGRIVVAVDSRGRGIATTAMEKALDQLSVEYGSRCSALAAQSHLERFYERFGFVRVGSDYIWDGIPHVDMVRTVP